MAKRMRKVCETGVSAPVLSKLQLRTKNRPAPKGRQALVVCTNQDPIAYGGARALHESGQNDAIVSVADVLASIPMRTRKSVGPACPPAPWRRYWQVINKAQK